ncbi:methyltransferase domain-containing protein [Nonlabens ponticola]|uniref:Methyltransferase n=1 Tax=Nonlabens ponticola TaxID=2496866 RepID=A0A3S9N127_9FLAO|nr:methyltransferase [Nonlabens ponticola]AZQ45236.1 methyltransferase [Nonlabens ponticola]
MYESTYPKKRFNITLDFLSKHVSKDETILDLGVENPFTSILKEQGYSVQNTSGEDLDDDVSTVAGFDGDVVTAFEIFEHLVNPYGVLKAIPCDKLLVSVPLKLWFSSAYRNKNDIRDQHYHEFEDWQLDYVLDKAGWEIKDSIKFTNPTKKLGLRPLLRTYTPRYYLVYCERK